jgi:Short C-terminal domain
MRPRPAAPAQDPYGDLMKLKELLDAGALTQEEFDTQKQKFSAPDQAASHLESGLPAPSTLPGQACPAPVLDGLPMMSQSGVESPIVLPADPERRVGHRQLRAVKFI